MYPARRLEEVREALTVAGLAARRIRPVRRGPEKPVEIVLVEATAGCEGSSGPLVEEPLSTRTSAGQRTARMEDLLAGRWELTGRS
jgi:tRNA1(Val) A37 N6-methylase TrmN6